MSFLRTLITSGLILATVAAGCAYGVIQTIPKPVIINHSPGGLVLAFEDQLAKWQKANTKVIIRGNCWSACTLFLRLENVCAEPSASFHFHAPFTLDRFWGKVVSPVGAANMLSQYPPKVREWIVEKGGLTEDWLHLAGPKMVELIPQCET